MAAMLPFHLPLLASAAPLNLTTTTTTMLLLCFFKELEVLSQLQQPTTKREGEWSYCRPEISVHSYCFLEWSRSLRRTLFSSFWVNFVRVVSHHGQENSGGSGNLISDISACVPQLWLSCDKEYNWKTERNFLILSLQWYLFIDFMLKGLGLADDRGPPPSGGDSQPQF